MEVNLTKLKRTTNGGLHGWFETDKGFDVRKPLNKAKISVTLTPTPIDYVPLPKEIKISWWRKLLKWFGL